jgi:hypothetical protein
MNWPRFFLTIWLLLTIGALFTVTTIASLEKNVMIGFSEVGSEPWGLATLMDAYFGFILVGLWIWWREQHWVKGLLWMLGIFTLGNFAMAGYIIIQMYRTPNFQIQHLFQHK